MARKRPKSWRVGYGKGNIPPPLYPLIPHDRLDTLIEEAKLRAKQDGDADEAAQESGAALTKSRPKLRAEIAGKKDAPAKPAPKAGTADPTTKDPTTAEVKKAQKADQKAEGEKITHERIQMAQKWHHARTFDDQMKFAEEMVETYRLLKPLRGQLARFYREVSWVNEATISRCRAIVNSSQLNDLTEEQRAQAPSTLTAMFELTRVRDGELAALLPKMKPNSTVEEVKRIISAHVPPANKSARRTKPATEKIMLHFQKLRELFAANPEWRDKADKDLIEAGLDVREELNPLDKP